MNPQTLDQALKVALSVQEAERQEKFCQSVYAILDDSSRLRSPSPTRTRLEPYGVTGNALDIRRQQTVNVVLNGKEFTHSFLICSLPTAAAGLIGTDFMNRLCTVIDFECGKMTLTSTE